MLPRPNLVGSNPNFLPAKRFTDQVTAMWQYLPATAQGFTACDLLRRLTANLPQPTGPTGIGDPDESTKYWNETARKLGCSWRPFRTGTVPARQSAMLAEHLASLTSSPAPPPYKPPVSQVVPGTHSDEDNPLPPYDEVPPGSTYVIPDPYISEVPPAPPISEVPPVPPISGYAPGPDFGAPQPIIDKLLPGVAEWAKAPRTADPQAQLAAAGPKAKNVAALSPSGVRALVGNAIGANWAFYNGSTWQIDIDRFIDPDVSVADLDRSTAANDLGFPSNGKKPPDDYTGNDLLDVLGPGTEPTIVQTRRCPGPTRLAINGRCYHKNVLPAKFRMNKPRKAVVSYAEGKAMMKGFRAATRIEKINKKVAKDARRLAPRRTRRTRRTTRVSPSITNIDNS